MFPIRTDSPLRGTPWANWALVAANVIVFLYQHFAWRGEPFTPGALDPRDPELLNYFTYQFLHGSPMHLFGNMLFLYIFGNNVADRIGNWGYIAFYLAGGVFAGIGHVLSDSNPVIGASGSVSAVTGAYLVLLPRSRVTILYFFFIIGVFEIPSMWLILFSFVKDFIFGFSNSATGVAHLAHLSGSVFGFMICFALLGVRMLPRDQFDLFALVQRWNKRRQYKAMVRQGYDPFGYIPAKKGSTIDPNQERIHDLRGQISDSLAKHQLDEATRQYLELRAIDPNQVLARQSQLDVANQLFSQQVYPSAADAYELFLRQYPKSDQIEQVQLMLGILYSRYLDRPDKAREHLSAAVQRLHNDRDAELARAELAKLNTSAFPT